MTDEEAHRRIDVLLNAVVQLQNRLADLENKLIAASDTIEMLKHEIDQLK